MSDLVYMIIEILSIFYGWILGLINNVYEKLLINWSNFGEYLNSHLMYVHMSVKVCILHGLMHTFTHTVSKKWN